LVEQIQKPTYNLSDQVKKMKDYNTSILTNNKCIYYYKRIYGSCLNKENPSEPECSQLKLFKYDFAHTDSKEKDKDKFMKGIDTMMDDKYKIMEECH
jgi:hypothetical protein